MLNLQSLLGFFVLLLIAWLFSENRRVVDWRLLLAGSLLQFALAALLLKWQALHQVLSGLNGAVLALQAATEQATAFTFGYLGGAPLPFEETQPGASFILAFHALPLVIVVSALTSILTYWRVLPRIIQVFSLLLERSLGVSGSVGLSTAANIFVGMVEAPLFIRPWLGRLSRSELFIVMTAGMATIAGTVLVLYASILGQVLPDAVGHLLIASLISAPAAIVVARLMTPETGMGHTVDIDIPQTASSTMDALTQGAQSGLQLFLNIIAMLLVLVALVHLANGMLGLLPEVGGAAITLERLLGYVMAPVVWLMGVPWSEAQAAGALMGVKTVLNELIAYLQLAQLPPDALSLRSRLIMTYALCGFANFGSLGIMIAGLTTMAPERRDEVLALGGRSIIAGTLATCCTGAVVGALTSA
ncbi:nucleoside transporter C-terminal domain-containing protein [Candidatus Thiothrix sp. Deng01]|uniref:Nucleoside transporter C-terminal domain-containing protein n=1 Tax=Candidatus Thiothrix phosphatis TaxID=3112415 RepID=A0ABU6D2E1_9GAMM|nr:nucleoside transporter C-terminal domain-containing protein [Candidatus Thiothrix sp. Deng01]